MLARTIEMYEDYVNEGDILAAYRWKHTLTAYDKLPTWCKLECTMREGKMKSFLHYMSYF